MTKPTTKQTKTKASTRKPRQPAAMTFTEFAAAVQPGSSGTIYDVRLTGAEWVESNEHTLIVQHSRRIYRLKGAGPCTHASKYGVWAKIGCIVPSSGPSLEPDFCRFTEYPDQSLRRAPKLDIEEIAMGDDGRIPEVFGWRCNAQRKGFRTPASFVPGVSGQFVPDETVAVSLRVPPEFIRICEERNMTPEELLRSFVGDLSEISMRWDRPRVDQYRSNGRAERELATEWLYRAH